MTTLPRLPCPVRTCHADNDVQAAFCVRCGTPLREYFRLSAYPAYLFNQGLSAARAANFARARDLFSAVIHWTPGDLEARHAFASACLELHDLESARCQWEEVRTLSPTDPIAIQGLATIAQLLAVQTEKRRQPKKPVKVPLKSSNKKKRLKKKN